VELSVPKPLVFGTHPSLDGRGRTGINKSGKEADARGHQPLSDTSCAGVKPPPRQRSYSRGGVVVLRAMLSH
jgi:hypothetical protein